MPETIKYPKAKRNNTLFLTFDYSVFMAISNTQVHFLPILLSSSIIWVTAKCPPPLIITSTHSAELGTQRMMGAMRRLNCN